jgi:hypothetical protein
MASMACWEGSTAGPRKFSLGKNSNALQLGIHGGMASLGITRHQRKGTAISSQRGQLEHRNKSPKAVMETASENGGVCFFK